MCACPAMLLYMKMLRTSDAADIVYYETIIFPTDFNREFLRQIRERRILEQRNAEMEERP